MKMLTAIAFVDNSGYELSELAVEMTALSYLGYLTCDGGSDNQNAWLDGGLAAQTTLCKLLSGIFLNKH